MAKNEKFSLKLKRIFEFVNGEISTWRMTYRRGSRRVETIGAEFAKNFSAHGHSDTVFDCFADNFYKKFAASQFICN